MDNFLAVEPLIRSRLETGLTGIAAFGSLMEFQALSMQAKIFPSVFIGFAGYVPAGDAPAASIQQVRQAWAVIIAVRDVTDKDGSLIRGDAGLLMADVMRLLMGWRPMAGVQPLHLAESPIAPWYEGACGYFPMKFTCQFHFKA